MMDARSRSGPDPSRVKALFGEVLDARESGLERDARRLLDEAEPREREAVVGLLEAHSRASGMLLDETSGPQVPSAQDEPVNPTVSGYEVSGEIGRGGFGIVYRARQRTPIDRPVAIKVLRRELVSDEAIQRFRAESSLLARMDHASIARVFDAGLTDQGQPFVAMEYIDASPLHRACEEMNLGVRERIDLMARVCDAMQHAHQRAVIHRDLKPANILVERSGDELKPRVIDFGIAKLLEEDTSAPETRAQVRLGTPRYMSPEQRDGSDTSDIRVDVYALGAMLCELLAGDVPNAPTSESGTRRSGSSRPSRIASDRTDRPIAHPKSLRGDLDRIVLKACAEDPEQRYASVQALGDDLRRYLGGRPVTASTPSMMYLGRKFVGRHRTSVTLASVLGLALVATTAVAVAKWGEARLERDHARASSERASFIGDFLLDMLLLTVDHNTRGAPPALTNGVLQDIADRAAEGLDEDPEHMMPMLANIGQFQAQSGDFEGGSATVRHALDFAIEHCGIPSVEVIDLRVQLHDLLWGQDPDGAKVQIELADAESAALFDDDEPHRLRVLQRSRRTIDNLERIADLYDHMNGIESADRINVLFALLMLQRFGASPGDQLETATRLHDVAISYYPPDHAAVIDAMSSYGDAMSMYAPSEEAALVLEDALGRSVRVLGYDHYTTEAIRRSLARLYGRIGRPEDGIAHALDDVESTGRRHGATSIQYSNALFELGRLRRLAGELDDARAVLAEALAIKQDRWPVGHAQVTTAQVVLAQVLHAQGQAHEAELLLDDALPHLARTPDVRTYAVAIRLRIEIRSEAGDLDGADRIRADATEHLAARGHPRDEIDELLEAR